PTSLGSQIHFYFFDPIVRWTVPFEDIPASGERKRGDDWTDDLKQLIGIGPVHIESTFAPSILVTVELAHAMVFDGFTQFFCEFLDGFPFLRAAVNFRQVETYFDTMICHRRSS